MEAEWRFFCKISDAYIAEAIRKSKAVVTTTIRLRFDRATTVRRLRYDRRPACVCELLRCSLNK